MNIFEAPVSKVSYGGRLTHYTSLDVLKTLLDKARDSGTLKFYASKATMMNDMNEWRLLFNRLTTGSDRNVELMVEIGNLEKTMGEPYVLCFIPSMQEYPEGRIPMWMGYANNAKGVCLHFDNKMLFKHFNTKENFIIRDCEYFNQEDVKSFAKQIRQKVNELKDKPDEKVKILEAIERNSIFIKERHWDYENEVRIVNWSKISKTRINRLGIIQYVEIEIPLEFLKKIVVGPLANKEIVIPALESIKQELGAEFSIESSKLPIR